MENTQLNFINLNAAPQPIICNQPLNWWIEKFQLPLNINYAPQMRANIRAFKKVFADYYPRGNVCFAAKALTHPQMFKLVNGENIGVDAASFNEVRCALNAGIPGNNIVLNGNAKEDFLIEEAINKNILIVIDNLEELKIINAIAKKIAKKARGIIRICGFHLEGVTAEAIFTAGIWSKFGVDINEAPSIIKNMKHYPDIELEGFHVHIGSQITEVEPYLFVLEQLINLGELLQQEGGTCKTIDIGGGYPTSNITKTQWHYILEKIRNGYLHATKGDYSKIYTWHNDVSNFAKDARANIDINHWEGEKFYAEYPKEKMLHEILTRRINFRGKSITSIQALTDLGQPRLIIEPGRAIVSDAGISLARVSYTRKIAHNHNLTALEMGVTNLCESMLFWPISNWHLLTGQQGAAAEIFETFVAGNLCFSADMLARIKISLPRKPNRGDILMVQNTGAYTAHFLAANANSFPRPTRLLVDDNNVITVIKKRDTYEEIFSLEQ
jgi:diaminopimelate decarboxylase